MHTAFKYRFYPTPSQARILAQTFGCCRVVWNNTLHFRREAYLQRKERWNYAQLSQRLTQLKKDEEFFYLQEVAAVPLQQTLRNQQKAFRNFFEKRARYPRFRSRKGRQGASYVGDAFTLRGRRLTIARVPGHLRVRWSQPLKGKPATVTVIKEPSGRYFVSFACECPEPRKLKKTRREVGIDLGLTHFATLSDGERVDNPRILWRDLSKLARAQRAYARTKPRSQNRAKARLKVARIHARISDRRRDFLHKLSTRLVRENQTIVVEDLNIRGMVRNHCLARGISDVGWGEFLRQLEYKCEWYGREFVKVDRWFPSSKRCHACGHVLGELPLDKRRWACPECGREHDRDHNAAKNILAAGRAATACGDIVRRQGASPCR